MPKPNETPNDDSGRNESSSSASYPRRCRIVLTGGPGGGKTTAADLFRRELGEKVVIVPEAATLLFQGGFPRVQEPEAVKSVQKAIYHVQRNLEDVQSARYAERILLCDRGTIDGAAYWPGKPEEFFATVGSSIEQELARYDAVIYFESAAVGGLSVEGGNPTRIENLQQAVKLDLALRQIWSAHPHFNFVGHNPSFFQKIETGFRLIADIANQLQHGRSEPPRLNPH